MDTGPLWKRLLEFLNEWTSASAVAHGGIELALVGPDGSTRLIRIRITTDEWDDMVDIPWGGSAPAADEVWKELARQHPEGIGRRVALDRDGNVQDELGPPST